MADVALKYDEEKARYALIPTKPLEMLAQLYTFGAKKYNENNWRKGIEWSRGFSALQRHAWAFWNGEEIDLETGLPHLVAVAWNAFALLEYMETRREFDDRPCTVKSPTKEVTTIQDIIVKLRGFVAKSYGPEELNNPSYQKMEEYLKEEFSENDK